MTDVSSRSPSPAKLQHQVEEKEVVRVPFFRSVQFAVSTFVFLVSGASFSVVVGRRGGEEGWQELNPPSSFELELTRFPPPLLCFRSSSLVSSPSLLQGCMMLLVSSRGFLLNSTCRIRSAKGSNRLIRLRLEAQNRPIQSPRSTFPDLTSPLTSPSIS